MEYKICTRCYCEKSVEEGYVADSRRKDGKRSTCKECDSEIKKKIRSSEVYRKKNAEAQKLYRQKQKQKQFKLYYSQRVEYGPSTGSINQSQDQKNSETL